MEPEAIGVVSPKPAAPKVTGAAGAPDAVEAECAGAAQSGIPVGIAPVLETARPTFQPGAVVTYGKSRVVVQASMPRTGVGPPAGRRSAESGPWRKRPEPAETAARAGRQWRRSRKSREAAEGDSDRDRHFLESNSPSPG